METPDTNIENNETKPPQDAVMHTFKEDANKYIRDKKMSLTDIMIKEQNKIIKKEKRKTNTLKIIFIIILFSAAVYGFIFAYNKFLNPPKIIIENSEIKKPFIYSDEIKPIYLESASDPEKSIKDILKDKFKIGEFIYIPFIKDGLNITSAEFLRKLKIPAPADFVNSLDNEFLFDIYSNKNENDSVIIFKLKDAPKAYASIIKWEDTLIKSLSPVILENNPEITDDFLNTSTSSSTAASSSQKINLALNSGLNATSSTSSIQNLEKPLSFYGKTINNIDIRIIDKNDKNSQSLLYGIFAEKYLIISTSEESFKNAVNRLKISLTE